MELCVSMATWEHGILSITGLTFIDQHTMARIDALIIQ